MLVGLALLWGASFTFIKIADRQLAPSTLILGRLGLAAVTLAVIVPFTVGWRETFSAAREHWHWLVIVALVNTAAPFWLLSWGETRIASGLASIIQGAVPVFNALFAFAFFREVRVTGLRLLGFALGFVGVALIVGGQPGGKVLGAIAVVGMAICYALGGLLMGRHLREVSPIIIALTSTSIAAAVDMPAGIVQAPHAWPGWRPVVSVVILGVPLLGFAYLLFFALITGRGAAYASLVAYLRSRSRTARSSSASTSVRWPSEASFSSSAAWRSARVLSLWPRCGAGAPRYEKPPDGRPRRCCPSGR